MATTNDTLSLAYNTSLLAAWSAGDTLALTAACTLPNCGASAPSTTVKVVKQASCSTSTALADCAFYIKAADAQGTETTKLTRTGAGGSTFQPLTLSAMTLDGTPITGVSYSWTAPSPLTPNGGTNTATGATFSATQVGEYKLVLTPTSGTGVPCELYITLSGVPCTIPTAAACGITANITPSDQGGPYLTSLAPGDQFTANDYVITVTSVTNSPIGGGGATFTGEGYARMKLTNGFSIDVPVVFGQANGSGSTTTVTPIKLNTCYQLVEGTVFTQYDPSWANIADVDNAIAALDDAKELIGNWLESFKGTPDQIEAFNKNIKPLLTPYKDDSRVQEAITKFEQLTTACPNYQPNATQTTTCQAAIDAAKAAYVVLQEFIDDLPPFPGYLLPGVLSIPGGRVLSDAPDEKVITVAALNACATAKCSNQTDPVRRFWGQYYGPSYDFWSVFSNGKKYYVMRTYENLYQEVYYYVPYGGSEYKVFYPNNGQTSAAAFADAGSKLVFDVGVMIATGGGASVSEAVVTNVADAFISALEESNGDLSQFNSALATNLAFSSLDFAEAAGPVFKNLVNKFKPNWGAFTQAARNQLNTLRSQSGWVAQVTSHKNSISPKILTNYGKVVKGTLSEVVDKLSSIRTKIDHKNKQILDAAGNIIATIQGKNLQLVPVSNLTGYTLKETIKETSYGVLFEGQKYLRKGDIEILTSGTSTILRGIATSLRNNTAQLGKTILQKLPNSSTDYYKFTSLAGTGTSNAKNATLAFAEENGIARVVLKEATSTTTNLSTLLQNAPRRVVEPAFPVRLKRTNIDAVETLLDGTFPEVGTGVIEKVEINPTSKTKALLLKVTIGVLVLEVIKDLVECDFCKAERVACDCFKQLDDATAKQHTIAVKRLCEKLDVSNKYSVCAKLLALSTTNQTATKAFLDDVVDLQTNMYHLNAETNLPTVNVATVDAWKMVYDAKGGQRYRKDKLLLDQVAKMRANQTVLSVLGSGNPATGEIVLTDIIRKNNAAPCNTCSNNKNWLNSMNEYMKDVEYFAITFGRNTDINSNRSASVYSSGITSNNSGHRFGAIYVLKVLRRDKSLQPSRFEGNLNRAGGPNCEPDALVGTKIYEFKSWSPNGGDTDIGSMGDDDLYATIGGTSAFLKLANNSYSGSPNSYTQFLCYLSNISSMNQLEYVFDKDLLNAKGQSDAVGYVKLQFQNLMKKPQEQQEIFNVIWGNNNGLLQSLWPPSSFPNITITQAKQVFNDWVNSGDNTLFKFITVK